MKRILYIVLDGLSESPVAGLNDKTPLEAAFTPNLDFLAQKGVSGSLFPVAKGFAPESDIAVISLLGYDFRKYYTGRGPLEAYAEGFDFVQGNLALRVNFATIDTDAKTIKDRRVARSLSEEEASLLAKEINSKVTLSSGTFEFRNTVGHRGVLVIRGMHFKLSGMISNTDPAYARDGVFGLPRKLCQDVILESKPLTGYESSLEAREAANLVNEFTEKSHKVLLASAVNKKRSSENKLAANIILCRDAGDSIPSLPKISELYSIKMGSFVSMPVEKGIALLTGMELVEVPAFTGHLDVDYPVWAKVALESLKKYDGLYIHIKGPDEPAHDGDAAAKKTAIEKIDKHFFSEMIKGLDMKDCVICVTSDHSTSSASMTHTSEAVPLLICAAGLRPDGTMSFSERSARLGSLGELNGQQLMPMLMKLRLE